MGLLMAWFLRHKPLTESYRDIASAGFMTGTGKPYAAAAIARMIDT
jgi:hypothetical protein